jgi:alpha-tubulin suppressor-like RCC1 family protein
MRLAVGLSLIAISLWIGQAAGAATLRPLAGVRSVTSNGISNCALLTSGKVDCWGYGESGQLGDGNFYSSGHEGSAVPVAVKGLAGTGTLSGVSSLAGDYYGYCALLTSRNVDCWGGGTNGQLGNGSFYNTSNGGSAVPVAVQGLGGAGTLGGVANIITDGNTVCALLTSRRVDCWGAGGDGELGNGTFYTNAPYGSAVPVAVKGVGGTGTLDGVSSLVGDIDGTSGCYCAVLKSGKVDCWGDAGYGDASNPTSAIPVGVEGVGAHGALSGVVSLASDSSEDGVGDCALLTSGAVDCWGVGDNGQLGNGTFYTTGNDGSPVPVAVRGLGGIGTLDNVAKLTGGDGFCALLDSSKIDCWGYGDNGQLGNGRFYTTGNEGSAVPVAVKGLDGTGTLGNVVSLSGNDVARCALLKSEKIDCWGSGYYGELGNGKFYTTGNDGSAVPVAVKGPDGAGTLSGVASVGSSMAVLTSGKAYCWGFDYYGELGNGTFDTTGNEGSAVPVAVVT